MSTPGMALALVKRPTYFIGDVHGKIQEYLALLDRRVRGSSIQVGDMGLGFEDVHLPTISTMHQFIRGNHDDPALCQKHPNYAGEFGYDNGLFVMGGAWSIDQGIRRTWELQTGGKYWWPDEELSEEQLAKAHALYVETKPTIVATHDCPKVVQTELLTNLALGFRPKKIYDSRTTTALQAMFEAHQPETWVFGHYHIDKQFLINGTKFICLNELSLLEL